MDPPDLQETVSPRKLGSDDALLAKAWTEGVPDIERAHWHALDNDGRAVVRTRLAAMLSYERDGNWLRRAAEAGLSRPRFFSMLKAWRSKRSLVSLVPASMGRTGKGAGGSVNAAVRQKVVHLLRDEPTLSKEQIVSRIIAAFDDAPSATTLRHLVDTQRASLRQETLGGKAGLGRLVAIDSSPVVVRRKGDEGVIGAMVGMVIDQASSLVLGYAVRNTGSDTFRASAEDAGQKLASLCIATGGHRRPKFEVALRGDAMTNLRTTESLKRLPYAIDVVTSRRDRPLGARLIETFGPKLGKLDVRPRAELPIEIDSKAAETSTMTNAEIIAALLKAQITEHNDVILKQGVSAAVPLDDLAAALMRIAAAA
jgi:hypothetical protein